MCGHHVSLISEEWNMSLHKKSIGFFAQEPGFMAIDLSCI